GESGARLGGLVVGAARFVHPYDRRRIVRQLIRRTDRAGREIAAAIGAHAAQPGFDAITAEGAFKSADHGVCRSGRQVLVAAFAIGTQFQQDQMISTLSTSTPLLPWRVEYRMRWS